MTSGRRAPPSGLNWRMVSRLQHHEFTHCLYFSRSLVTVSLPPFLAFFFLSIVLEKVTFMRSSICGPKTDKIKFSKRLGAFYNRTGYPTWVFFGKLLITRSLIKNPLPTSRCYRYSSLKVTYRSRVSTNCLRIPPRGSC